MSAKEKAMGRPLIPVATYMNEVLDHHRDNATSEVCCTTLAEDAADHFHLMGHAPSFETPEWVFELAYHTVCRDEDRRAGKVISSIGWMVNQLESDWF